MRVRDYLLCTQSALDAVRGHVEKALDLWLEEWLGHGALGQFNLQAHPADASRLQAEAGPWWESRGPWGRAWMRADAVSELIGLVFGTRRIAADGLAREVGEQAVQAWLVGLTASMTSAVPIGCFPADAAHPGQQVVQIDVSAEGWALALILCPSDAQGGAVVKAGTSPLGRLDQALAAQRLRLEVVLGDADVDLGTLQDLAVGDVLRLDRRLDEPAQVMLCGQKLRCAAYPGSLDGRVAVEIGR